jgi:hypothetical protein
MTKHVGVPKPKNSIALRIQPSLAHLVMSSFPIIGVLTSVKLGDETVLVAHKVDNERADRNLATKAQSIEAMGKQLGPKDTFSVRHF